MYVTSTAFLKDDIANILAGIARVAANMAQQGRADAQYQHGYNDALAAVATALGIYVAPLAQSAAEERQR